MATTSVPSPLYVIINFIYIECLVVVQAILYTPQHTITCRNKTNILVVNLQKGHLLEDYRRSIFSCIKSPFVLLRSEKEEINGTTISILIDMALAMYANYKKKHNFIKSLSIFIRDANKCNVSVRVDGHAHTYL